MFEWKVTVQRADGPVFDQKVRALWSPTHDLTLESVGAAARIQQRIKDGGVQPIQNYQIIDITLEGQA